MVSISGQSTSNASFFCWAAGQDHFALWNASIPDNNKQMGWEWRSISQMRKTDQRCNYLTMVNQLFDYGQSSRIRTRPLAGCLFCLSPEWTTRLVSSAYLRLLVFLPAILIPACASFSPAFLMMYSAFKLNKQGDNIQPWRIPFPIWNQSVVSCSVLTIVKQLH